MDVALLVFPHAGGTAAGYRRLLRWTKGYYRLAPVDRPGLGSRRSEPRATGLASLMVDQVDAAVRAAKEADCKTTVLYGHSLGALIAHAVAVQLTHGDHGVTCERLIVSGRNAPHTSSVLPTLSILPDDQLLHAVMALGGRDSHVLRDTGLRSIILPILRAELAIAENWRPEIGYLDCPVTCVAADEDPATSSEGLLAWRDATADETCIHEVHGGHFVTEDLDGRVISSIILNHKPTGRRSNAAHR